MALDSAFQSLNGHGEWSGDVAQNSEELGEIMEIVIVILDTHGLPQGMLRQCELQT